MLHYLVCGALACAGFYLAYNLIKKHEEKPSEPAKPSEQASNPPSDPPKA